jgi:RES domain-containing protein
VLFVLLRFLQTRTSWVADYVVTPIEVPDDIDAIALSLDTLPPDWDAAIASPKTADIGTEWAETLETVVLVVPSAIISREQNYILNPRHPNFSKVVSCRRSRSISMTGYVALG